MIGLATPLAMAAAFGAGISLHAIFFHRGEWDLEVPKVCGLLGASQGALILYISFFHDTGVSSLPTNILSVAWLGIYLVAGIFSSMSVYRLFFHRLKKFPGPFWARLSNWYVTYLGAKDMHLYDEVQVLHRQYGDFVRLGPTELSIIHPDSVSAIYSAQSPCSKGPWYNVLHPRISLQVDRDKPRHAKRRKAWDNGFSTKSLRDYEPRVQMYTDQLVAQVEKTKNSPINMTDWCNFYSFDVMGSLSFGRDFNMLQSGEEHYIMRTLHADMTSIGYLGHLTWLFPFFKMTPGINTETIKFLKWLSDQVDWRQANEPNVPDVFSWVLRDYNSQPKDKQARWNLEGDAHLIVVAGSDTTAATLTCMLFHLATDPSLVARLRVEVDEYFRDTPVVDHMKLGRLPLFNAAINETLRLHPPVPGGAQRVTPPEGLHVGDTFIPGNVIVQTPMHTIFRDERYWEMPNEFIPERWTTKPELTKDPSIFFPFNIGPYGCAGKQLALMEIRYSITQMIHRYDIALAPGQTAKAFIDGKRDTFTLACAPLNLVFTPRKKD